MYRPDVLSLRKFYSTPLGAMVCRRIRRKLLQQAPELASRPYGDSQLIVGLGYAAPYLVAFNPPNPREEAVPRGRPAVAVMPAVQGVIHWPRPSMAEENQTLNPAQSEKQKQVLNISLLSEDYLMPFADESVDVLVVVHDVEFTDQPLVLMHELWRVLHPRGKLLLVVPNRLSIWSRIDKTPFGYGQPYSPFQLKNLLHEAHFTNIGIHKALFVPPTHMRTTIRITSALGRWLRKLNAGLLQRFKLPRFLGSGVLIAAAEKQLYAPTPVFKRRMTEVLRPNWVGVPSGQVRRVSEGKK